MQPKNVRLTDKVIQMNVNVFNNSWQLCICYIHNTLINSHALKNNEVSTEQNPVVYWVIKECFKKGEKIMSKI